jgi:hypothetical protein
LETLLKKSSGAVEAALASPSGNDPDRVWLHQNARLLRTAEQETKGLLRDTRRDPVVMDQRQPDPVPRVFAIAHAFFDASANRFGAEGLEAFLNGIQDVQTLKMGEIWSLKPMLEMVVLERVAEALSTIHSSGTIPALIESLRGIGEADWKTLFEDVCVVDVVLAKDPAGAYDRMDFDSRDMYRRTIADLAAHSSVSEKDIAAHAVQLAAEVNVERAENVRAAERRAHVGYYLIDGGVERLRQHIGYKPPPLQRVRDFAISNPNAYYLFGIEICTFLAAIFLLERLDYLTPIVAAFFFLIIPATQAAVDFMNNLTGWLLPPRALPKLDFSKGIPEDCSTMVAVPTLLLKESQVRQLISDLEIRYLANTDPNLYFALVTDWPDAQASTTQADDLVELCRAEVEALNARHGSGNRTPFYLFHRVRVYNSSEKVWMGWERKRGKLLDLNQLLRGASDKFPIKVGNVDVFPKIRYILTVDSDTQVPRESAHRMIGAIAHPLNRAVIDPETNMVVEGYGILQPRIGISIDSASRSRLAAIYSGQTGFDIYTRAISDVYQDLFGEGIFTGKGLYEVDVLRAVLERRFPENWLLSHDLIEGAYARVGLLSDVELIDDYPSHFSAYSRRKHRWVRGDWQVLRWFLPRVPDLDNKLVDNPISLISRWKLVDNARRSLLDPATFALFLAGWFLLPGDPKFWTMASVVMLLMPVFARLYFSILRAPLEHGFMAWARDTGEALLKGHLMVLLQIVFLLHQALLSTDAIVRSLLRTLVTRRKLLEWETAAEAESSMRQKSTVDTYLEWSPLLAGLIGIALYYLRPEALPVALPVLFLWFSARFISDWLNRRPLPRQKAIRTADLQMLRLVALRTWRFFREHSNAENGWLIPDNFRENPVRVVDRISPTNLGFLLNARIAAVHFGQMTVPEFARETRKTLETVLKMPRFRGHLLNWYQVSTQEVLNPQFVSTVDSGNLAACLWTLKQAARSFLKHPPEDRLLDQGENDIQKLLQEPLEAEESAWWTAELEQRKRARSEANADVVQDLEWIADTAHRLVTDMDFRFLYDNRKKLLAIGYDVSEEAIAPSSYDLLASESRIAVFVAIAKGDIPQEAWFHLGRKHVMASGHRVLLSWTGTMFEYLMPNIWMRHYTDTLMEQSIRAVVAVQRDSVRGGRTPWGISESACDSGDASDYGYSAFGIPSLAMRLASAGDSTVISPYSAFLALTVEPRAAMKNIRKMESLGWYGHYGFIEAAQFAAGNNDPQQIRMWMAHHQGMALLSICNLLKGGILQEHFHAEAYVMATELLLHERAPRSLPIDESEAPVPAPSPETDALVPA